MSIKWIDLNGLRIFKELQDSQNDNKYALKEDIPSIEDLDISSLATKEELGTGLSSKQDTITDLEDIRTNANKSSQAMQMVEDLTAVVNENEEVAARAISDIYAKLETTPGGGSETGSGVEIVGDISELDPNAELGSIACVAKPGSSGVSSLRDLPQATEDEMVSESIDFSTKERIDSLEFISPSSSESFMVGIMFAETSALEGTGKICEMMLQHDNSSNESTIAAYTMGGGSDGYFVLGNGNLDTWTYDENQISELNAFFENGDLFYLCTQDGEGNLLSDTSHPIFNYIDNYIKAVSGQKTTADIYVKKDDWENYIDDSMSSVTNNISKISSDIDSVKNNIKYGYSWPNSWNQEYNDGVKQYHIVNSSITTPVSIYESGGTTYSSRIIPTERGATLQTQISSSSGSNLIQIPLTGEYGFEYIEDQYSTVYLKHRKCIKSTYTGALTVYFNEHETTLSEYLLEFSCGSTAKTISFSSDVIWAQGLDDIIDGVFVPTANATYFVHITGGKYATYLKYSN